MSQRTLTIGETTFDHISYDREVDVLYLSVGRPAPANHTFGTPEGHAVRLDNKRRIVGITLVNPRVLLERGGLKITLPEVVQIDRANSRKPSAADDSSRREVDGLVVAVAVAKCAPELVVEGPDVGVFQAAAHLDHVRQIAERLDAHPDGGRACGSASQDQEARVLCGREADRQRAGDGGNPLPINRAGRVDALGQRLGVEQLESLETELSEHRKFGVDEAERAMDRRIRRDLEHCCLHKRYLLGEPLDELALVTARDRQLGLAEERLGDRNSAFVALRVDDPHPGRRDGEVVDVCSAARDPPVVQENRAVVQVLREGLCDALFAAGATGPGCLVCRLAAEREQNPTDARMLLPNLLLTVRAPSLVLAPGTRAGGSGIEVGRVRIGGHLSTLSRERGVWAAESGVPAPTTGSNSGSNLRPTSLI